jgi:hypothetical protein
MDSSSDKVCEDTVGSEGRVHPNYRSHVPNAKGDHMTQRLSVIEKPVAEC